MSTEYSEEEEVEEDTTEYEVEEILDDYLSEDGIEYFLVKWKNYPESENSWEPVDNLDGAPNTLQRYLNKKKALKTKAKITSWKCRNVNGCNLKFKDVIDRNNHEFTHHLIPYPTVDEINQRKKYGFYDKKIETKNVTQVSNENIAGQSNTNVTNNNITKSQNDNSKLNPIVINDIESSDSLELIVPKVILKMTKSTD